jgi:hypothetical protein
VALGRRDRDSLAFESPDGGSDQDWQVFAEERPRRPRRAWLLLVAAALVTGVVAFLVIGGRNEDEGATSTTATPTTAAPTTQPATTASTPPTSVTVTGPPALVATPGRGPVLDAPTGRRLVGVTRGRSGGWDLIDVELDSGDMVRAPIPGLSDLDQYGAGVIPVARGGLVYGPSGPAALVLDDGDVSFVGTDYPQVMYPGPDTESAWSVDFSGEGRGPVLQQVALADSSVLAAVRLDFELQVVGPDGEGGVLVTMLGGPTWRVRPGGAIERLETVEGSVVVAGRGVVVEKRCDDRLECSLFAHRLDRTDGVTIGLPGPPYSKGEVSPDGRMVALWITNRVTGTIDLSTLDLATGEVGTVVSNGYDELPSEVHWVAPDVLVFDEGGQLHSMQVDRPGAEPEPILVNGEPLALSAFAVGVSRNA